MAIDQLIDQFLSAVADFVSAIVFYPVSLNNVQIPFILIWLFTAAFFFTFYFKFINLRKFLLAVKIVKGDYDNEKDKGEVTHFQALATALSGTVGLGNIAGVAIAISTGGPGATFWMIIAGFLGMTSKFVECTLGVKYRKINADGSVSGGPMYYLSKGFAAKGFSKTGKFLGGAFAIMCAIGSLGGGNLFQGNQASRQIIAIAGGENSFLGQNSWIVGLGLALLVASVIIGGMKSIARVTEKLVPFMCLLYMSAGLVILALHLTSLPAAFLTILEEAFSPKAVAGGFIGVMIQGIRRAHFSNEAGIGSAPIVHAAVKTDEPLTEGFVSLLEPFIDTVVVCTTTALIIIVTGAYKLEGLDGIAITSYAFSSVINWFPYALSIAVFLFALSTMISWSYYGIKAWNYLFGESYRSSLIYRFIFCLFTTMSASINLQSVVDLSDALIFSMSIPNIIGLYFLAPELKGDLKRFMSRVEGRRTKVEGGG